MPNNTLPYSPKWASHSPPIRLSRGKVPKMSYTWLACFLLCSTPRLSSAVFHSMGGGPLHFSAIRRVHGLSKRGEEVALPMIASTECPVCVWRISGQDYTRLQHVLHVLLQVRVYFFQVFRTYKPCAFIPLSCNNVLHYSTLSS
jgi:hypothetical protein